MLAAVLPGRRREQMPVQGGELRLPSTQTAASLSSPTPPRCAQMFLVPMGPLRHGEHGQGCAQSQTLAVGGGSAAGSHSCFISAFCFQATIRGNRTDNALVLPTTTKGQQPLHLKPPRQTSIRMQRKTEASAKNSSDQSPQVSSNQGTVLDARVKRKSNPQMCFQQTSPVKKIPAAPEKRSPLQKTNASQVKTMGGNGPKNQASSKPPGSSGQTQARHTVTPALASRLPMPKQTNHTAAVSGRYTVPGKSSQFKPVSSEKSGGQRSTKPTAGVGKKATCQKPVPLDTFQNSRLRLPKTDSK